MERSDIACLTVAASMQANVLFPAHLLQGAPTVYFAQDRNDLLNCSSTLFNASVLRVVNPKKLTNNGTVLGRHASAIPITIDRIDARTGITTLMGNIFGEIPWILGPNGALSWPLTLMAFKVNKIQSIQTDIYYTANINGEDRNFAAFHNFTLQAVASGKTLLPARSQFNEQVPPDPKKDSDKLLEILSLEEGSIMVPSPPKLKNGEWNKWVAKSKDRAVVFDPEIGFVHFETRGERGRIFVSRAKLKSIRNGAHIVMASWNPKGGFLCIDGDIVKGSELETEISGSSGDVIKKSKEGGERENSKIEYAEINIPEYLGILLHAEEMPGFSIIADLELDELAIDGKKYLFDFLMPNEPRISMFLSEENMLNVQLQNTSRGTENMALPLGKR